MANSCGDNLVAHLGNDNHLSYADWQKRSLAIAGALLEAGVRRGNIVGLAFSQNSWLDYLVAYVATLRLGAVALSLPAGRTPAELGELAGLVAADMIVSDSDTEVISNFSGVIWPYSSLAKSSAPAPDLCDVSPGECAEILFTSGTTGRPKAIWCAHSDLVSVPTYEVFGGVIRLLGFYPIGSSAAQGIIQQMLQPTRYWSGRLEVWNVQAFHPRLFLKRIHESGITALRLTPAIATLLVQHLADHHDQYDVSTVAWIKLSASYSSPTLIAQIKESFANAQITNFYGSTESGRVCLRMIYGEDYPASLGRPAPGTDVQIRDAAGQPVANGTVGEIWLRAIGVRSSRPPIESGFVQPDAWVSAGDLGIMSEDGSVYLFGRLKDVINVGGVKISPVAIECALEAHPCVQAAAAFPVPHSLLGEVVGAAIVPKTQSDIPATTDLLTFAAARLRNAEIPRAVLVLKEFPVTPGGKVDKRLLGSMITGNKPILSM